MQGNKKLKRHKWYSAEIIPPLGWGYVVMTDMGHIFEAECQKDGWHLSEVHGGKVYFPLYENQECIYKWMRV